MVRRSLQVLLMVLGAVLMSVSIGAVAYAQFSEWRHRSSEPPPPSDIAISNLSATIVVPSELTSIPIADEPAAAAIAEMPASADSAEASAEEMSEAVEDPEPIPPPEYGRPLWMAVPRINVNSAITPSVVSGGYFTVPNFRVGHHAGTSNPGEPGNSVYNGHLESIDAGRVFGRLRELKTGDAVYVFTEKWRLSWVVQEVKTVPNTDSSFIYQTDDTRVTLYTCTGSWNPRTRDYSHRFVVVASLAAAEAR